MTNNDQNIERIVAYIAENRAAYSLDALRAQLLAAGYSADDVAAAFARVEGPQAAPPPIAEPQASPSPAGEPQPSPVPAESGEQAIERMVAYLEQNRQQYTIEALRQQLLSQGQRPELVEVAVARVRPKHAGRGAVVRPALPWAGGALVLSLIAAWVAVIDGFDWFGFAFVAILFYGGAGALLLLVGAVVQAFRRPVGLAILFGGLFALALSALGVVIFFGVCLVLLSQGGF